MPASLDAALAELLGQALRQLPPPERRGARALLRLLAAAPQPPTLAALREQGLAEALPCLPGWGWAFATCLASQCVVPSCPQLLRWLRGPGGRRALDAGEEGAGVSC